MLNCLTAIPAQTRVVIPHSCWISVLSSVKVPHPSCKFLHHRELCDTFYYRHTKQKKKELFSYPFPGLYVLFSEMKHHLSTHPPTVMYCTWNSSREQDVMLSFLSLNQNSISAFLDISCLWTSFSISLQIGLLQSQSQGWQNHSVTTRTGCSSLSA